MEAFVERMIEEHAQLVTRIQNLESYIHSDNEDDRIEFANKCVQLRGMQIYENALYARLVNQGITFDGEDYHECIASITKVKMEVPIPDAGNDVDADKENVEGKDTE